MRIVLKCRGRLSLWIVAAMIVTAAASARAAAPE